MSIAEMRRRRIMQKHNRGSRWASSVPRYVGALILTAAVAMMVVACGDDSSSSSTAGNTQSTGATKNTALKTVKMGVPPVPSNGAPYLADKWGYFNDEGLKVEYVTQPSGVTLAQATVGGSIDMSSRTIETPMLLGEQGQQLRNVVGQLMVPGVAIVVPKGSDINSVADLSGKKVGVAALGSRNEAELLAVLLGANVDEKTVKRVAVGIGPTSVAALQHGQVDALIAAEPTTTQLVDQGARVLVSMNSPEAGTLENGQPATAVWATKSYIDENPDIVKGVARAVARAERRAKANPDEAATTFAETPVGEGIDPAVLKKAVANTVSGFRPEITPE